MTNHTQLNVVGGDKPPPLAEITVEEWTTHKIIISQLADEDHGRIPKLEKEVDDLKHDRTKRDAIIALVAGTMAVLLTLVATGVVERFFK